MLRLRYSAASRDDLKEIARFIAKDKPVAARQWIAKIRKKCRLAAKHPDIGDDRRDHRNIDVLVGPAIAFQSASYSGPNVRRLKIGVPAPSVSPCASRVRVYPRLWHCPRTSLTSDGAGQFFDLGRMLR